MLVKIVVALALLAGAVSAQTNFTIDINQVSVLLRASWCNSERNVCKVLCDMNDKVNDCDPNTLNYNCICGANNSAPALYLYQNSLPDYICQEAYKECIAANQNNQLGQDNCTTTIRNKCATLSIANYTSASTSAASASATPSASAAGASGTASGSAASATPSKASAAVAFRMGSDYGSSIVAAALVAALSFLL